MSDQVLQYDKMVADALRSVVRQSLEFAAENGLPGEHHFYITFRTATPGVEIHESLAEKYPDEMTIVVQHQYWDLVVSETGFKITLSFDKAPRPLVIPFDAVTAFFDPAVQFGLKFEVEEEQEDEETASVADTAANADDDSDTPDETDAEIITLDAFRKK